MYPILYLLNGLVCFAITRNFSRLSDRMPMIVMLKVQSFSRLALLVKEHDGLALARPQGKVESSYTGLYLL